MNPLTFIELACGDRRWVRKHLDRIATLITNMEERIMTKLDDYIAAQTAVNTQISTAVDGLVGDVQNLNDQIAALVAAQGTPTPEQQAALDALTATGQAMADKLTALDAVTPPVAP